MQNGTATAITFADGWAIMTGTNYTLYRIAKDRDEAERIADKIYNVKSTKKVSAEKHVPSIRM